MAETLTPPPIQNAIAEQPGLLTPRPWSRYFQAVRDQVLALVSWQSTLLATTPPPDVGPGSVTGTAETAARGDHTHGAGASGGYTDEQAQDAVGTILTEGPTVEWIYDDTLPGILAQVKTQRSMLYDANGVMLNGDVLTPGATQLYGTDGTGTKGWYAQPVGVPSYTPGTFTVTGTGFVTPPTGTARYVKIGTQVTLMLPALTGTSNATTFTLTGIPAALNAVAAGGFAVWIQNNGVYSVGFCTSPGGGIMTVYLNVGGGAFTASGAKGLFDTSLSYLTA